MDYLIYTMDSNNLRAYMYEPMFEEGETDELECQSDSSDEEDRIDNTVRVATTNGRSLDNASNWCQCGSCSTANMSDIECICCTEWSLLDSRLESAQFECITKHEDIAVLCLNRVVLNSMWAYVMQFRKERGPIPATLNNRLVLVLSDTV